MSYTKDQRVLIVKTFYKCGESCIRTTRSLQRIWGRRKVPNETTIRKLIKKFERSGSVMDMKSPIRPRSVRSLDKLDTIRRSVASNPRTAVRRRCQELEMSKSTLQTALKKDLHLHPFKLQVTQKLEIRDYSTREHFANQVLQQQELDPMFARKIIFSDEAHFHIDGFINKQNCRVWAVRNPQMIKEKPLHSGRCTVWCGIWAGGVIGPYFFEDGDGNALTVNGHEYRSMITHFLCPEVEAIDVDGLWFQQDGATCHTARETTQLLQQKFPGRLISNNGDFRWPPRSCDLTPCDFFLWGFVKSRVYANNPRTVPQLKHEIRRVTAEINSDLCQKVIDNFLQRVRVCQESHGGHLKDVVFHN